MRIMFYLPSDPGSVKGCQGRQPHGSVGLGYSMSGGVDDAACFGGESRVAKRYFEPCAPCSEVSFQHAFGGVSRDDASEEGQVSYGH